MYKATCSFTLHILLTEFNSCRWLSLWFEERPKDFLPVIRYHRDTSSIDESSSTRARTLLRCAPVKMSSVIYRSWGDHRLEWLNLEPPAGKMALNLVVEQQHPCMLVLMPFECHFLQIWLKHHFSPPATIFKLFTEWKQRVDWMGAPFIRTYLVRLPRLPIKKGWKKV